MKYTFTGETVLVSGSASGIGKATAHLLAANGLAVLVSDIQKDAVEKLAQEIKANGGRAVAHVGDVSRPEDSENAVDLAVREFGALHFAVNNAGVGDGNGPMGDINLEGWQRVIDINLNGVAYGLRFQIPAILAAGGGAIVNMSSILGIVGEQTAPAYTAAKHGVTGLTRATALEYSARGIRVNSIHPGYVDTPLLDVFDEQAHLELIKKHPIGRLGTADEIAHAIAFLLSDGASFITGASLLADGGYTAL